jgi:hypothetical protein
MAVDEPTPAAAATAKPSDPDDLSAYNLDDYDEETKGAGVFSSSCVINSRLLLSLI